MVRLRPVQEEEIENRYLNEEDKNECVKIAKVIALSSRNPTFLCITNHPLDLLNSLTKS